MKYVQPLLHLLMYGVAVFPVIVFGQDGGGSGTGGTGGGGQGTGGTSGGGSGTGGTGGGGQGTGGTDTTGSITLQNPLTVDSIEELLQLILDIILIFAVPIIVFFIIYSGFLFVTAQGKPDQLEKAKNALLWTVIGGVLVLGANVLLDVIVNTVNSLQP